MALELVGAVAIAAIVLWVVFQPVLHPAAPELVLTEPEAPEETRRGVALLALKEIEFDRATGKLSDADYEMLKGRFSAEAIEAIRAEAPRANAEAMIAARLEQLQGAGTAVAEAPAGLPTCRTCGPRPETDAVFCSSCGASLAAAAFCTSCGTRLAPESRFCGGCGARVGE